jgi:phosphopantetheine--protein transferase-like protein
MIITGIDIIEIPRISDALARWGTRFVDRLFTFQEINYCQGRANSFAVRFAAKEATMKALQTGIWGINWKDVEVISNPGKAPFLCLHGKAEKIGKEIGLKYLSLSLSHSKKYAVASVVGMLADPGE